MIPVWEKVTLTLKEAASFSNIGINKLREMTDSPECPFILWVGSKKLIKREKFIKYLEQHFSI